VGKRKGQWYDIGVIERADQQKLLGFIKSKVKDQDEAEEIYQETLISAYESLGSFSGKSTFLTWLVSIARHEICDYYRKKKIKTFLFSKIPWLENVASQALGPEQELLKKELQIRVRRVMGKMREEYRQVLKLKYYEGLSVIEIAYKLNESPKTIESRLSRARVSFAKAFSVDRG
jgi:RNA polymerase sigma-70 factor, ECF subfamily